MRSVATILLAGLVLPSIGTDPSLDECVPLTLEYKWTHDETKWSDITLHRRLQGDCLTSEGEDCSYWADEGECASNPDFMLASCPDTCACKEAPPPPPPPAPPPAAPAPPVAPAPAAPGPAPPVIVCEDSSQDCPGWAQSGQCSANPDWMNENCKLSCSICQAPAPPVGDEPPPPPSPVPTPAPPEIGYLRVALPGSTDFRKGQCSVDEGKTRITDQIAQQRCEEFCGAGPGTGIVPMVLGSTDVYGFNLESMNALTLGANSTSDKNMFTFNPSLNEKCLDAMVAQDEISYVLVRFIDRLNRLDAQQKLYSEDNLENIKEFQNYIRDKSFMTKMANALDKPALFRKEFESRLSVSTESNEKSRDLSKAIKEVEKAGETLQESLDKNIEKMRFFKDSCNKMLLAVGNSDEYLLDICSQANAACITHPKAEHVGCACGISYAAKESDDTSMMSFVNNMDPKPILDSSTRRLSTEAGSDGSHKDEVSKRRLADKGSGYYDVCAEVRRLGVKTTGDLADGAHAVYYERCVDARRQLHERHDYVDTDSYAERATQDESRQLADDYYDDDVGGICLPPPGIVFSDYVLGEMMCSGAVMGDVGEGRGTPLLRDKAEDMCSQFCSGSLGQTHIELLLGDPEMYGMTGEEMTGLCKTDPLKENTAQLEQCAGWSENYAEIRRKTSTFEEQNVATKFAKRAYQLDFDMNVQEVLAEFQAAEFLVEMEFAGDKLNKFKRKASNMFNDRLLYSNLKDRYGDEVEKLYKKGKALLSELKRSLPNLEEFNEKCNDIFMAPSNQQSNGAPEFMLDMCAQGSASCIDSTSAWAEHVGCCCGYNPATQLGGDQKYQIGGSENFRRRQLSESSAENSRDVGFSTEHRQLTEKKTETVKLPDVCAETYVQLMPLVACIREDWDATPGFDGLFEEYQNSLKEANADYCKFQAEDTCRPTTTTQAPPPTYAPTQAPPPQAPPPKERKSKRRERRRKTKTKKREGKTKSKTRERRRKTKTKDKRRSRRGKN